jgi:phosphohistidine phosphatase SixA
MRVIIARHGDEKRVTEGEATERREAFGQFIRRLELKDVVVFSSPSPDAKKTSAVVIGNLGSSEEIELHELSDRPDSDLVESILDEAEDKLRGKSPAADTWILIGHHPRLSQFLTRITGKRARPLGHLHAVCISAADPTDLRLGRGHIQWRYPCSDVKGDKLGPKLQSKMVVGALLAGFDFTALLELLKDPKKTGVIKGAALLSQPQIYLKFWEWNDHQWTIAFNSLAIFCLSVALVLFIASVYIFDTLAMPEGFLAHEPEWPRIARLIDRLRRKKTFHNNVIWFGFVYASMIHTWGWVFSPAVALSALAALLLVGRLHSGPLLAAWIGVMVLAGLYYLIWKPQRMID